MVATMRESGKAPGVELEFIRETPSANRASYIMKPSFFTGKPPPAWRFHASEHSMALDRLVEVALSPTGILSLDPSCRDNAPTPGNQVRSNVDAKTPKSASSRDGSRAGSRDRPGEDGGSEEKSRHSCSNGINLSNPAATSPSPSPSSEAHSQRSAGYFQQQKLKRRLSSFNKISTPAPERSTSSLRVHVEHRHVKRFKFAPRFKALVDISC